MAYARQTIRKRTVIKRKVNSNSKTITRSIKANSNSKTRRRKRK